MVAQKNAGKKADKKMFWKNRQNSNITIAMILLRDKSSFDLKRVLDDYKGHYGNEFREVSGDNISTTFIVEGEMIAVGYIPAPIPPGDVEGTAQYAYNWPTALDESKGHKSHLIVSVMQGGQDQIKRFKILTQVICSLLRTTDAIGVYKGIQSLLIPKEDYLSEAELMNDEYLPLNLWIYFGLRTTDSGNSVYTYGLKGLGKNEMEVLDSSRNLEDIRSFMFNIAHYVLGHNVDFQDGQTCGFSAEEKILIRFSKGYFVEGNTFKLYY